MKFRSANLSRFAVTLLILSSIFGNLFPFLNIDLGFVILTPFRSLLIPVGIYSLIIWLGRFKRKEVIAAFKKDYIGWCTVFFFAAWFALGAGWILFGTVSGNAVADVVGIFTAFMLAFCCFTLINTRRDVHYLVKLLVLCGVILSVIACLELVIGNFVPGTRYYLTLEEKIKNKQTIFSPTTVFYNPNDFAAFMLLCLSLVCYCIIQANTIWKFLCYLVIALLMVIPTVLTNSTFFNIYAVILIGLTAVTLLLVRARTWKLRLTQVAAIALVSILFVTVGMTGIRSAFVELNRSYFTVQIQKYYAQAQKPDNSIPLDQNQTEPDASAPQFPEDEASTPTEPEMIYPELPEFNTTVITNPDTLNDQLNGYQQNYGTVHIRKWLIFAGLDYFMDSPLIGNGPDSFHEQISQDADYLQQTRRITNPHCFYIELLSQYGGILLAIYLGIILYLAIRSGLQTIRELRREQPGWGMLCFLLVGIFSAVVFMPSSIVRFTSIWIFLILAVCAFCKGTYPQDEEYPNT